MNLNSLIAFFLLFGITNIACSQKTEADFDRMVNRLISKSVEIIQPDELKNKIDKMEKLVLLDAREMREYKISHIKNAIYAGYDNFDKKCVSAIDKNTAIVVYCSVGYRSEKIGEKLKKMGYNQVYNLYGGIFKWINSGYAVVDEKNNETQNIHPYNERWGKWLRKGIKKYE